ncbi:MAG: hypothetical protein IJC13_00330 [Clostridia bacterium]|nr:hypothetical protein [Clostridia bacterium]
MKQSTRIRMYREYCNHPLKKEYENKKSVIIKKNKSIDYYLGRGAIAFFWIMIPGFGVIFAACCSHEGAIIKGNGLADLGLFLLIILLGVVNLIAALYAPFSILEKINEAQEIVNRKEIDKLKEEYAQKGLYEVHDPAKESCSEYDDDIETIVCSATREYLTLPEINWCEVKGNCIHCARFWRSMGIDDPDLLPYEITKR